jgi:hypothetical protein
MKLVSAGLEKGKTMTAPGMSDGMVKKWYAQFGDTYGHLSRL